MSVIYITSQAELEAAFREMGFVEGTTTPTGGRWYYQNAFPTQDENTPYFTLNYYSSSTVTPIVYVDSAGTSNNMMETMTAATQVMKIEYYKLYGGGLIFRAARSAAADIATAAYNRMLNFAIFPLNNNAGWNVIYNTGNQTTYTAKLDTLDNGVSNLYYISFSQLVTTMSAVNITRLYNNRNGFIDAEVYIVTVPLALNTENTLFTTINGIGYLLGFGRANGNESRYAFRLAESA